MSDPTREASQFEKDYAVSKIEELRKLSAQNEGAWRARLAAWESLLKKFHEKNPNKVDGIDGYIDQIHEFIGNIKKQGGETGQTDSLVILFQSEECIIGKSESNDTIFGGAVSTISIIHNLLIDTVPWSIREKHSESVDSQNSCDVEQLDHEIEDLNKQIKDEENKRREMQKKFRDDYLMLKNGLEMRFKSNAPLPSG